MMSMYVLSSFFFNYTSTPDIYTLSLHDALPILAGFAADAHLRPRRLVCLGVEVVALDDIGAVAVEAVAVPDLPDVVRDRKSTRLNSSHGYISYAVFCLKKKK